MSGDFVPAYGIDIVDPVIDMSGVHCEVEMHFCVIREQISS